HAVWRILQAVHPHHEPALLGRAVARVFMVETVAPAAQDIRHALRCFARETVASGEGGVDDFEVVGAQAGKAGSKSVLVAKACPGSIDIDDGSCSINDGDL